MESQLITANNWFGTLQRGGGDMTLDTWRRTAVAKICRRFKVIEGGFDDELEPVRAFVNRGRWIVVCPHCGGGEYAWEEGYYFCCSCLNAYMGHRFRRLVFPKFRARIESALVVRTLENRHWLLKETVKDLLRENKEHADELLVRVEGGSHGLDNADN